MNRMNSIIPLVRLDQKEQDMWIAGAMHSPVIVIRMQDLVCKKSGKLKEVYFRIKAADGINAFLHYDGQVILSQVMRDDLIQKLTIVDCIDIISAVKPAFWTTSDGETYNNEYELSKKELARMALFTKAIMHYCPDAVPLGHVKGADAQQVKMHLAWLEAQGISNFMFHTGDFCRNGVKSNIQQAKYLCSLIKKPTNTLILYGFGSQKYLEEFAFADAYITYTHVIMAQKGMVFEDRKRRKNRQLKASFKEIALQNLRQMWHNLKDAKKQRRLFEGGETWEAAAEVPEASVQK